MSNGIDESRGALHRDDSRVNVMKRSYGMRCKSHSDGVTESLKHTFGRPT